MNAVDWVRQFLAKPPTEAELLEADAHALDIDIDLYNRDLEFVAEQIQRWDALTPKVRERVVDAANELEVRREVLTMRKMDLSARLAAYDEKSSARRNAARRT